MNRRWLWLLILFLAGDALLMLWWWRSHLEHRYDNVIRSAAARYQLPPALVKAVIWRESRFQPHARGRAGELGLMQLTETAAQEWADATHRRRFVHADTLSPVINTEAGCYYLSKILKRYTQTDRPFVFALADYNAGRGNVLRWMKGPASTNSTAFLTQMDFPGTREYIRAILERHDHYRTEFR